MSANLNPMVAPKPGMNHCTRGRIGAESESLSGSQSDSISKATGMTFGHEQLDVYRAAVEYVGWAFRLCERLKAHRNAKDQLLRASQSIPLNIAEGNGKSTEGERRRFFEIARASTLECAAIQDVLEVCGALSPTENADAKKLLDRIVAMLTRLGQRGYLVREVPETSDVDDTASDLDSDTDPDSDIEQTK